MSGHSKWSTIKHKKAIEDNRRGKVFTKLGRAISIAAKEGGPETGSNFKLRLAVEKAKQFNMPKKNIERAIERGSSSGGGEGLIEAVYEGYGPMDTAIMVEVVTDNKNRTAAEIKKVFERGGGRLGQSGSVAFLFKKIGRILLKKDNDKDSQMLKLIDLGAEDLTETEEEIEAIVAANQLAQIKQAMDTAGFTVLEAELSFVALNCLNLDDAAKEKVSGFLESLDDLDDVLEIYTNLKL